MAICQSQNVSWKYFSFWKLLPYSGWNLLVSLAGCVLWQQMMPSSSSGVAAPRPRSTAGLMASLEAQEGMGLRSFYSPHITETSRKCCGVTSDTTALQTWQLPEKTMPLLPMSPSVAFDFRKGEKQCFEFPRTKYFQKFISTGKVKRF